VIYILASLRNDEVLPTLVPGEHNIAWLGGDAHKIMANHMGDKIFSQIFINYPQPPEVIGAGTSYL
jgi:tRNA G46 methylase TrmB